jgi:hypothetical protein
MKQQFHEDLMLKNRDMVDAPDQDFDWDRLYQSLNDDATNGGNDPALSQTVVRILQMLLPPPAPLPRRIQPESLGMRLIALAWVLSPAYFDGNPSVCKLARRCGVRHAALANYTGYYSRLLRFRNRGQSHAWNWLRNGTPRHRGKGTKLKVKRNVPASGKAAASGGESKPDKGSGGVAPAKKRKRARTG